MKLKNIRSTYLALAFAPAIAGAQARVANVTVNPIGTGFELSVNSSRLATPMIIANASGTVHFIEVDNETFNNLTKTQVWKNGLISVSPEKVEGRKFVVLRFTKPFDALLQSNGTGQAVVFEPADYSFDQFIAEYGVSQADVLTSAQKFVTKSALSVPSKVAKSSNLPKKTATNQRGLVSQFVAQTTLPSASSDKGTIDVRLERIEGTLFDQAPLGPSQGVQTSGSSSAHKFTPATSGSNKSAAAAKAARVSLDFVNADIVQIIKAIALQTGANIVTSPDVTGKISVKLNQVTITEALNLVTSLSGLKYSQVGKTYVVTTPAKFKETLRGVGASTTDVATTRIIPIYSGQASQIKSMVTKTVPANNGSGQYDLFLPNEKETTEAGADKKDPATPTSPADLYLLVVGTPSRLGEVEQMVTHIDRQLCSALGISRPESNLVVTDTYFVRGSKATVLVEAIAGKGKTGVNGVEMIATPESSSAQQTIVLKGRAGEVQKVRSALEMLDSDRDIAAEETEIVNLMFADPRSLREALIWQIPGLAATVAPSYVANPFSFKPDDMRKQAGQKGSQSEGTGSGGSNSGAAAGAGSAAGGGVQDKEYKVSNDTANEGLVNPFGELENIGQPMKLLLQGTKQQLQRARELISKLDVAPMQVAVEMRVMEISREELLRLGIDWNAFTGGAVKFIRLNNQQPEVSNRVGVGINSGGISGDVTATLDSIANNSNLISRPNLLVNDGNANEVFIGDAIRYIEAIQSTQNGTTVTTGLVRAGVRLSVFPRVGDGGMINMKVRTAVTYLKGFKQIPQIGGELPLTSERIGHQDIVMQSGETYAIGGLIQEQERLNISGLPILKDLPVLGQFFRRTSKDKVKTELVIFVTATSFRADKGHTLRMPTGDDTSTREVLTGKAKQAKVSAGEPIAKKSTGKG
jgi:type II secretory pathway component GspD/PulD (secretin)